MRWSTGTTIEEPIRAIEPKRLSTGSRPQSCRTRRLPLYLPCDARRVEAPHRRTRVHRPTQEESCMSQEELADRSGLHLTAVGRIERAEREPGIRTVYKARSSART